MLGANGKKVVLASSADSEEVQHYIELRNIEKFLTAAVSKDNLASSKPAGDIFAAALAAPKERFQNASNSNGTLRNLVGTSYAAVHHVSKPRPINRLGCSSFYIPAAP